MKAVDLPKVKIMWKEAGYLLEQSNYCIPLSKLRAAEFLVTIVEQMVGDLLIIPPMAPHQVMNRVRKQRMKK